MAIDLKQEVSLASIKDAINSIKSKRGAGSGGSGYPTKTTMNLYQVESQTTSIGRVIVVGVLLAVGICLFVKFGVIDQLALLSTKESELSEQKALLSATTAGMGDTDDVKDTYEVFRVQYGSGGVDASMVLDMVDTYVRPKAKVSNLVLSDATLTITLDDVQLSTVGEIAKDLDKQASVSYVNVSTASNQKKEDKTTTATIVAKLVSTGSKEG